MNPMTSHRITVHEQNDRLLKATGGPAWSLNRNIQQFWLKNGSQRRSDFKSSNNAHHLHQKQRDSEGHSITGQRVYEAEIHRSHLFLSLHCASQRCGAQHDKKIMYTENYGLRFIFFLVIHCLQAAVTGTAQLEVNVTIDHSCLFIVLWK